MKYEYKLIKNNILIIKDIFRDLMTSVTFRKFPVDTSCEFSSPKRDLKTHIEELEKDYNELVMYTQDENNILTETSKKVEQLEKQLKRESQQLLEIKKQRKFEEEFIAKQLTTKFQVREKELINKIADLEEQLKKKDLIQTSEFVESLDNCNSEEDFIIHKPGEDGFLKEHLYEDIKHIQDQLILLQDVLNNCSFVDNFDDMLIEDPVQQVIESFNSKIKTSKELVEFEIWKQSDSFNEISDILNEPPIIVTNEFGYFNELLNELSAFENDIPNELINDTKGESIKSLKFLIKIYESLLKKNELIGSFSKKFLSLQEQVRVNEELHNQELSNLKASVDQLNQVIMTKDQNLAEMKYNLCSFEEELDNLREKSYELQNKNSQSEQIITEYQIENRGLKAEINKIKESITLKNESLENEIERIKDFDKNNDILNNKINLLESNFNNDDLECSENLQRKEKLKFDKINELTNLNRTYLTKIKTMEDAIDQLTVSLGEYEQLFNNEYNATVVKDDSGNQIKELEIKINKLVMSNKELTEKLRKALNENENRSIQDQKILNETKKNYIVKIEFFENEINKLNQIIVSNNEEIEKLRKVLNAHENKSTQDQEQLDVLNETNKNYIIKIEFLEHEINKLNQIIVSNNEEIEKLRKVLNAHENKSTQDQEQLNVLNETNKSYIIKIEFLEHEINKLNQIIVSNNEEIEKLRKVQNAHEDQEQLDVLNETNKNYIIKIEFLEHEINKLNQIIVSNNEEIEKLRKVQNAHENKSTEDQKQLDVLNKTNKNYIIKIKCLENEINKLNQIVVLNNEEIEKLREYEITPTPDQQMLKVLHETNKKYVIKVELLENEINNLNQRVVSNNEEIEKLRKIINAYENKSIQNNKVIEKLRKAANEYENKSAQDQEMMNILNEANKNHIIKIEFLENEINALKSYNKEATCIIDKYKADFTENDKKVKEYKQLNENLESIAEILSVELKDCKKMHLDLESLLKEKEISLNNQNEVTKKFEIILSNVIEQFVKEEKALLLVRHTQEQREYFKNVRKDLKDVNATLKSQLQLLQNKQKYDLDKVNKMLLKSNETLKEYSNLEKSFLQSQIQHLDLSSKAYLQEISVLKKNQEEFNKNGCPCCNSMKSEITDLNRKLTSKETKLTETLTKLRDLQEKLLTSNNQQKMFSCLNCAEFKNKNLALQKQINNQMSQIVDLQIKIYEEQNKKAELKYSDMLKYCQEQIKIQSRKLEKYENVAINKKSIEIQCNLQDPDESLQQKYLKLKQVCQSRKNEIDTLKKLIER